MQLNLQNSLLTDLIIKRKNNAFKKPNSWPDIRRNLLPNSIRLLVDERYPIGFVASVIGGYSVKIDEVAYGDYNNQAQFSMADWSEYTGTEGYAIEYPTGATKAHIIDIYPQTEGAEITAFHCARVAASDYETQGLLWVHFNIKNAIECEYTYNRYGYYANRNILAITALNNILKLSKFYLSFYGVYDLEYVPILDLQNKKSAFESIVDGDSSIPNIIFKNVEVTSLYRAFNNTQNLKKIKTNNLVVNATNLSSAFYNSGIEDISSLNIDWTNVSNAFNFLVYCKNIKNMVLDTRTATGLKVIGCYGDTTHFMTGFKGLRVSDQAPFDHATPPQINVSYTGMDRQAIVTLFNDLPTVTGGQIINVTGCTGANDLTADDKAIATDKGWTITL